MAPEQLWILNPKKLLEEGQSFLVKKDCWICCDPDKPEPLIQPCKCTGDVSSVHHECLRKWLEVSCSKYDDKAMIKCRVCDSPYEIKWTNKLFWEKGFTIQHWAKTVILVTLMCIATAAAWVIIHVYVNPKIRLLTAGLAVIIVYVCIKLLGENTLIAYQRAKMSSINIVTTSNSDLGATERLNTICQDVANDV